jgi:hypothetical protein
MPHSILLQIRKIIFENFNDVNVRFNNDQILELLKKDKEFDQTITIDDLENDFKKIENDNLVRCIAQNFTTQWFKLYENVEKLYCNSCSNDIFLGKDEARTCPNPECGSTL